MEYEKLVGLFGSEAEMHRQFGAAQHLADPAVNGKDYNALTLNELIIESARRMLIFDTLGCDRAEFRARHVAALRAHDLYIYPF